MAAKIFTVLFVGFLVGSPAWGKDYIRDTLRIKMRDGPSLKHDTISVLASGDAGFRLDEEDGWIKIRTARGQVGWVPGGYLTDEAPASVALPHVEAALEKARSSVKVLETRITEQSEAVLELDTLRQRNHTLEEENMRLSASAMWKYLLAGAAIFLGGMLVGGMVPRGSAARSRRIKI